MKFYRVFLWTVLPAVHQDISVPKTPGSSWKWGVGRASRAEFRWGNEILFCLFFLQGEDLVPEPASPGKTGLPETSPEQSRWHEQEPSGGPFPLGLALIPGAGCVDGSRFGGRGANPNRVPLGSSPPNDPERGGLLACCGAAPCKT